MSEREGTLDSHYLTRRVFALLCKPLEVQRWVWASPSSHGTHSLLKIIWSGVLIDRWGSWGAEQGMEEPRDTQWGETELGLKPRALGATHNILVTALCCCMVTYLVRRSILAAFQNVSWNSSGKLFFNGVIENIRWILAAVLPVDQSSWSWAGHACMKLIS